MRRRSRRSTWCPAEYCANAARVGEYFIGRLRELQGKFACIGDVRGKGLMLGMELVEDRTTKVPASKLTEKLIRQALPERLLLLSCGQSTIRFMPPLMVTKAHVDEAITILDASLGETLSA